MSDDVQVHTDNRVRLVGAVLAAGDWPALERKRRGAHAVHPHAKATRHYVADHSEHPAVTAVNDYLAEGGALSPLFATALRCQWPTFAPQEPLPGRGAGDQWTSDLADFYVDTGIAAFFWSEHEDVWEEAVTDLGHIFREHNLARFLKRLSGRELDRDLVVMPNLTYPALETIAAGNAQAYHLILPPPKAVGESPPWAYRDGADWILAKSCANLTRLLLADDLAEMDARRRQLLPHAATVIFLERTMDEAAALFYLVRTRKEADLPDLPEAVDAVRDYLEDPGARDWQALLAEE